MSYKLGFLKLRFSVDVGSRKEKILKKIIGIEDSIKRFLAKLLIGKRQKHHVIIDNQQFYFRDIILSRSYVGPVKEIELDTYGFKKINFKKGDIVIDIGANIGVISIYLAKKYPFLKIYSFEPFKMSYNSFLENIKINDIPKGVIYPFNKAVTKDGRDIVLKTDDFLNSVSLSIDFKKDKLDPKDKNTIPSVTLDNIVETALIENKQDHIKLLKMDCELSEYEILKNTKTENLTKISYLSAEFHEKAGFENPDELETYVKTYIPNTTIVKCKID